MKAHFKENILLRRVQHEQDADAYGELYDAYVSRIHRFVMIKVSHRDIAEDIVSDIFLKTWNYLTQDIKGRREQVGSFSGLVYRIARFTLIDYYRTNKKKYEVSLENVGDIVVESHIVESIYVSQESERIIAVIKKMKREYQEIILLRYIEDMSIAEIAHILEKKQTNVRVTLHRAVRILKNLLNV